MHPSEASEFEWDYGNQSEFACHGIEPEEVEEVFDNHPDWKPNKRDRAGDWRMTGRTNGGRRLTIIIKDAGYAHTLRAITGWES